MNILFLSRWLPYPANNGSKLRIKGLLRGLSKHHNVTLLSFTDHSEMNIDLSELQSMCDGVHTVPWKEYDPQSWRAKFGFFSLQPRFLIDTFSKDMADLIRGLVAKKKIDLVIASQLSMAAYHSYFAGIPAVFEELELGQFRSQFESSDGILQRIRHGFTWFKLRLYLSHLLDNFRVCTMASDQERQLLLEMYPRQKDKIITIPNCIQFEDVQGVDVEPVANQLIYSGSFRFYANYDAMQWFVDKVFSRILERIPETQLLITGDHADLSLSSNKNITFTGYVDDIKSVIASSTISLAPLLSGGGTRLKILEAMALGVPVVATSKGAEGLGAVSGKHLLIADSIEDFANQVTLLLMDPILREHISTHGKRFVKEKYDCNILMSFFLQLVDTAVSIHL